ncbi:hypothetical protein EII29_09665 [Leptotrichia sp. OH3620_COT-345]|uniref:hypothetical protein n=1 Tax=Leptotrichia sp. OH3620_COT-345 TaxID=2491048 RepID=UPI000F648D93|nr:hypothetical protein [Leptotrichia sp. OH3620_COT-345]RRD38782.1 hypothetical protein EII29_09665 [Leptotrichia sp. OH3620_COT-345]
MKLNDLKKDFENIRNENYEIALREVLSIVKEREAVKNFISNNKEKEMIINTIKRKIRISFDKKDGFYYIKYYGI